MDSNTFSTSETAQTQRPDLQTILDEINYHVNSGACETVFGDDVHRWHKSDDKWRGSCPWHESQSGTAFYLTPSTGQWYCPACEVGGKIYHYIHLRNNGQNSSFRGPLFMESVREAADAVGISMPRFDGSKVFQKRQAAIETHLEQIEWAYDYTQSLTREPQNRKILEDYLQSRGFSPKMIERLIDVWGVSVLPSSQGHIKIFKDRALTMAVSPSKYLLSTEEVQKLVYDSRLVMDFEDGRSWTPLAGKLIVPWRDENGTIVNLYGRSLKAKPSPKEKFFNLRDIPWEDGSSLLKRKSAPLGFDKFLKYKQENPKAIPVIVEGLLDVLAAQACGDATVVGYIANKPPEEQAAVLLKHGIDRVIVCLDPDQGGKTGTISSIRQFTKAGILVDVTGELPKGQDPDEYIVENGIESWKQFCKQTTNGLTWYANHLIQEHNVQDGDLEGLPGLLDAAEKFDSEVTTAKNDNWLENTFRKALRDAGIAYKAPASATSSEPLSPEQAQNQTAQFVMGLVTQDLTSHEVEWHLRKKFPKHNEYQAARAMYDGFSREIAFTKRLSDQLDASGKLWDILPKPEDFDPMKVLPPALAQKVIEASRTFKIHPIVMTFQLIFVVATQIKSTKFAASTAGATQPASIYLVMISPTGTGKSETLKLIIDGALEKRKKEIRTKKKARTLSWMNKDRAYKRLDKETQKAYKNDTSMNPGTLEEYVGSYPTLTLENTTAEALDAALANNFQHWQLEYLKSQGIDMEKASPEEVTQVLLHAKPEPEPIALIADEFAGLIQSFDQYHAGGKGRGKQVLLKLYTKGSHKIDRVSKAPIDLGPDDYNLSIYGNLTKESLAKTLPLNDESGLLPRTWMIYMPAIYGKREMIVDREQFGRQKGNPLEEMLETLFDDIRNMQFGLIFPSEEAQALFNSRKLAWEKLGSAYEGEVGRAIADYTTRGFEFTTRAGLVLQHIWHAFTMLSDPRTFSAEMMERALYVTETLFANFCRYASEGALGGEEAPQEDKVVSKYRKWLLKPETLAKQGSEIDWTTLKANKTKDFKLDKDSGEVVLKSLCDRYPNEFQELGEQPGRYGPVLRIKILSEEDRLKRFENVVPFSSPVKVQPQHHPQPVTSPQKYFRGHWVHISPEAFEGLDYVPEPQKDWEWEITNVTDDKVQVISRDQRFRPVWVKQRFVIGNVSDNDINLA